MLPRSIKEYDVMGRTFITGRLLWDGVTEMSAKGE